MIKHDEIKCRYLFVLNSLFLHIFEKKLFMMRILLWIIIICKVFLSLNVLFVIDKYSNIYSYFQFYLFSIFTYFEIIYWLHWNIIVIVCVWLFDFKIVCEILIDVIEECFIKITSAWQSCFDSFELFDYYFYCLFSLLTL